MTEQIEGLTAEIADLRARLEREDLDADAATEVLERITALAQRAAPTPATRCPLPQRWS